MVDLLWLRDYFSRVSGDDFIKLGYWSQLVLLGLVDWGTLAAFADGQGSVFHYVGFSILNVILLVGWWFGWQWLKDAQSPTRPPDG